MSALPEGARFCPSCGARQAPDEAGPATGAHAGRARAKERRIITTLFCDLVDFTALAEQADPEDVDGLLRPYFALTRHIIEQHGGAVEKFIGDAVVGTFGVPTLHEDDAERAVRAAIRLQERMSDLPAIDGKKVQARIGVNTGHALVRLGVDPASGEGFLVGDAVNTAARLQQAAPPGGIVVGETTQSMAAQVATYEAMGPVRLKGKRQDLRPWLVTGGTARPGLDLRRSFATDFVGREVELGILTGMFDKALASATPQIAIIVADAGLGKTRLVHELATWLDERSDVIAWWRQAQCPAYGEGLSLWPLAQIVREHAGILDDDDERDADDKLLRALDDEPDVEWLAARLRPLLGLPSRPATKEENFAAWLRFVELMARSKPTVLVFEDVHWASPVMVEFLWYLAAHVDDVPLLGIATARPEFLQAYPDYEAVRAGDERLTRTVQLDLHPLSAPEVDRLVSALMHDDGPAEVQTVVAERSGGIPLYAEELARLVKDSSIAADARLDAARTEVSESLHALIAARLDSLEPALKELLSDAAVLGEQFSTSGVAALSGRTPSDVEAQLRELAVRELVRPARQTSLPGGPQYAFWHALTRDVAYARMTRSDRASRHLAVAEYMQGRDPVQTGDSADVLAHHYTMAFTLIQATGDKVSADRLREPAAMALAAAGDRAMALDCSRAKHQYQAGLDLLPEGSPLHAELQAKLGRARMAAGETLEAVLTIESAIDELNQRGDKDSAGAVMMDLYSALLDVGDPRAYDVARQAVAAFDDASPSPELIAVLEGWACAAIQLGRMDESLVASRRCLEASRALGVSTPIMALACRAWALCATGRICDGVRDARRLLKLVRSRKSAPMYTSLYSSIAELFALYVSVPEARSVLSEGLELARTRHDDRARWSLRICELELLGVTGQWDLAIAGCHDMEDELAATDAKLHLTDTRCLSAIISALRGDREPLTTFLEWWRCEQTLYFGQPELDCLAAALAYARLEQTSEAAEQLLVLSTRGRIHTGTECLWWPEAARAGMAIGSPDLARLVADRGLESKALPDCARKTLLALKAEVTGDAAVAVDVFGEASRAWMSVDCPHEAAQAHLGRARCLIVLSQSADAAAALEAARLAFTDLHAAPALSETQALARRL